MDSQAPPAMTVQQLRQMIDDGAFARGEAVLLDVREPHEVAHSAIPLPEGQARHVPMRQIPAAVEQLDRDKAYAVLCRVGGRSAQVTAFLRQHGFTATNITGGINAYAQLDPAVKAY